MDFLNKSWSSFNKWRKKYMLIRIIILLAIFSLPIYERLRGHWLITDLVRYACTGIFAASIPQSEYALCRYYKFREKARLQKLIFTYTDTNHDGKITAEETELIKKAGIDPKILMLKNTVYT